MPRYHATVELRRSATETFGCLATFSNAAQRDAGVLAGEQLDPGPASAGSRFRLVMPFLGPRRADHPHYRRYLRDRVRGRRRAGPARRCTSSPGIAAGLSGPGAAFDSISISYDLADLEDLDAVRAFARDFCATHYRLDVLIHNTGAIHPEFRTDTAGT